MLGEGIEQLYVFAVFAVLGVALSLSYLFGIGVFRTKVGGFIFDAIFGFVAIYLVWKVNLETNNGEFRLFIVVGLALGALTTCFTCKTALDKASTLLYNLFTTKVVNKDDRTLISQKVNGDTIGCGSISDSDAGVHAVGNSHSDVGIEGARRLSKQTNRRIASSRRSVKRAFRVSSNRRVRKKVGRSARQNLR